ncbi:MAG: GntR family transcriptional regulator [Synergistales bacterium]|jgi:DNA-binding GntR family transcriptional regulator
MNVAKDNRLWVRAYKWIKDAIDGGVLKTGEPLSENRLSQEIEISRTPIREALRVLAQEGYVRIVPAKGAFVSEVSLEDLKEIYDIRKLLEPFAAVSAVHRVPEAEIRALENEWHDIQGRVAKGESVPWSDLAAIDQRFHFTLIRHSTNKRIQQILFSYHAQIERFQSLSAKSLANVEDTVRQHIELIACLKERNGKLLSERLYEHIVKSEENVLKDYYRG